MTAEIHVGAGEENILRKCGQWTRPSRSHCHRNICVPTGRQVAGVNQPMHVNHRSCETPTGRQRIADHNAQRRAYSSCRRVGQSDNNVRAKAVRNLDGAGGDHRATKFRAAVYHVYSSQCAPPVRGCIFTGHIRIASPLGIRTIVKFGARDHLCSNHNTDRGIRREIGQGWNN